MGGGGEGCLPTRNGDGVVGDQGGGQSLGAGGVGIDPGPMRPNYSRGGRLKAESELDSVRQALTAMIKACWKAEEENGHLTDERLSLLMELGAIKKEFAAF